MTPSLRPILLHAVFAIGCATALTAQAYSPAEHRAHDALAALSARYTALWTQMPAAERPGFAREQRHWLHVTRWEEQRRCAEAHPGAAGGGRDEIAAACLAEVTLRHLNTLPQTALAAR
jgi:uncharacterized NAD(P)/FAD-binding protein YdhS